jgi:hypothetical protein
MYIFSFGVQAWSLVVNLLEALIVHCNTQIIGFAIIE